MADATFPLLSSARVREAVPPLVRAFDDSPIMRYLMPQPRVRRIGTTGFFRAILRDAIPFSTAWVAEIDGKIVGAAVWLPANAYPPSSRRKARQFGAMLTRAPISPFGMARSVRYLNVVEAVHPHEPHWYLALLGIDPGHQGHGLGTQLLAPALRRSDEEGLPCYLETDKERNLAFYARHRFDLRDTLHPAGASAPPTWTMWRTPKELGQA